VRYQHWYAMKRCVPVPCLGQGSLSAVELAVDGAGVRLGHYDLTRCAPTPTPVMGAGFPLCIYLAVDSVCAVS
jgi:hypothetical protein